MVTVTALGSLVKPALSQPQSLVWWWPFGSGSNTTGFASNNFNMTLSLSSANFSQNTTNQQVQSSVLLMSLGTTLFAISSILFML